MLLSFVLCFGRTEGTSRRQRPRHERLRFGEDEPDKVLQLYSDDAGVIVLPRCACRSIGIAKKILFRDRL